MTRKSLLATPASLVFALGLMIAIDQDFSTIQRANSADEGSSTELKPAVAKIGVWLLGGKLTLSALIYFRNGDASALRDAQEIERKLGIPVREFPPLPKSGPPGLPAALDYFGKGGGTTIASDIRRKYGNDHATLYEIATRLFLMWNLYQLDPKLTDTLAQAINAKCISIALPDRLWRPALNLVSQRAKYDDVKSAVIKMDDDMQTYLGELARAESR